MKKQLVITGIIALLVSVGLSGCTTTDKNKFIGTWSAYNVYSVEFFSDGTILTNEGVTTRTGKWEINDGKITFTMNDDQIPYTYNYSFSGDDKVLTMNPLAGGVPAVYTKQ